MGIVRQYELEQEMFDSGKEKYRQQVANAKLHSRESDTSYGSRLLGQYLEVLIQALSDKKTQELRGKRAVALKLTRDCPADAMMLIGLKSVLDSITKKFAATHMYVQIGTAIENEVRFTRFREAQPFEMQSLVESFKKRNIMNYSKQCGMVRGVAKKYEDDWVQWTLAERTQVGGLICSLILEHTDLLKHVINIKKGKKYTYLEATEEVLSWVQGHQDVMELLRPNHMPCVIPPKPWTEMFSGGYYSDFMQSRMSFVKFKNAEHAKALKGHDYGIHMHGVNLMQNTAWKVNTAVLEVAQEIWKKSLGTGMPRTEPYEIPTRPFLGRDASSLTEEEQAQLKYWKYSAMVTHTAEQERRGKIVQYARTFAIANKYKDEKELYYVYTCDFRGRVYCTTVGMSPQGDDFGKALIHFAERKAIGVHGGRYLSIHGANVYGEDKLRNSGRVQWVKDNREAIVTCAADPLSSSARSFWGDADKPFQFLAFCFEYAAYLNSGKSPEFLTCLPIGADGTCNGLQHFSALLADPVGAAATNIVPSDEPQDIYQRVADVVTAKLKESDHPYAETWLNIGITRKITKSPVMTLPYGSTLSACKNSVDAWLRDTDIPHPWTANRFKAAAFLGDCIWEAIGEVVVAAREAMQYLRACAGRSSKANMPMIWTTPSGFRIVHAKYKGKIRRVRMALNNKPTQVSLFEENTDIDSNRLRNGVSPNYIHGMDSAHMVLSVIHAHAKGVTSFAMIHDDYGTHACDMDVLQAAIREEFVNIYKDHTLLDKFTVENTAGTGITYPEQPSKGDLDVSTVLESEYFFG